MKKILYITLTICLLFALCACGNKKSDVTFTQQVTIIKMLPTPKYKTAQSVNSVDAVIDVLGQIEKLPIDSSKDIECDYMIKINVDGNELVYMVGSVFTDADGTRYQVVNYDIIMKKLADIYAGIDAQEIDYA